MMLDDVQRLSHCLAIRWRKRLLLNVLVAFGLACCISMNGLSQPPQDNRAQGQNILMQAKQAELAHNFAAAAKLYQNYLASHPSLPEILQRLGLVYYLSGQFALAIPPLTKALSLNPSLWGSDLFLGISYYRMGKFDHAEGPLRRALAINARLPEADYWLGATLLARNQAESAIPYLRRASEGPAVSMEADSLLAEACQKAAESYAQQIARLDPNSYRTHELKAQALEWQGSTSGALLEYQRALEVNPQLEGAHRSIGEIYWKERHFDLAAREFEAELRLNPLDFPANLRLGEYNLAKGNPQAASAYLHSALASHPAKTEEAWHFLGLADLAQHHLSGAEADLQHAVQANPQDPSNYQLLMQVYSQMGQPRLAEKQKELFEKFSALSRRGL
ncbi:MAG TPA: tetratricopeptide repeat protein [Terriglobia bacterium]|nr:tetratricopeptide repeat protein [Terriglobia bacterium]